MIASNNMTFLINSTFSELVRKLIPPIYSDLAIARSLFIFCCSIDINSLMKETLPKPIEGSPLEHLWSVYCKKSSIASFFAKLCRHTSVPVKVWLKLYSLFIKKYIIQNNIFFTRKIQIISGIAKNYSCSFRAYDFNVKNAVSQWNAVYVNNGWRLLDIIWASRKRDMEKEDEWKIIQIDGQSVTTEDFDKNVNYI